MNKRQRKKNLKEIANYERFLGMTVSEAVKISSYFSVEDLMIKEGIDNYIVAVDKMATAHKVLSHMLEELKDLRVLVLQD